MAVTTQDFQSRIDLTGLNSLSASQIMQMFETGMLADDKGMLIVTADTDLNVPDVPNPDVAIEGITPLYWKRYIWVRLPSENTYDPQIYVWNPFKDSDAVTLKWHKLFGTDISGLQSQVSELYTLVSAAQSKANDAHTLASGFQSGLDAINAAIATINENFTSGFADKVRGKYRITADNIVGHYEQRNTLYTQRKQIVDIVQAGAVLLADDWIAIDLSPFIANFPQLTGLNKGAMVAKIHARIISTIPTITPSGATTLYLSGNPSFEHDNSRHIYLPMIAGSTPLRGISEMVIEVPTTGAGLMYYKWESNLTANYLQMFLLGFGYQHSPYND
jgi:hypothetical protein